MVQLVEITGVLNEKGCIEIPIVLLAQTGIRTGELVPFCLPVCMPSSEM